MHDTLNPSLTESTSPHLDTAATRAVLLEVMLERRHQIDDHGWTPDHDDLHGMEDFAWLIARRAVEMSHRDAYAAVDGPAHVRGDRRHRRRRDRDPRAEGATTMSRSRYGQGRHRQVWITVLCPSCTHAVQARRTLPGHPLHVRAHWTDDGDLCPCQQVEQVVAA